MSKTIILSFDDAVINHRTFVAPLLKSLGFNATFFICRWNSQWRKEHGQYLMDAMHIRELANMGFDIGNHTWHHHGLKDMTPEKFEQELDLLDDYLAGAGVPKAVSFAYPGGPSEPYAHEILRRRGFKCGRIVKDAAFNPQCDDPM